MVAAMVDVGPVVHEVEFVPPPECLVFNPHWRSSQTQMDVYKVFPALLEDYGQGNNPHGFAWGCNICTDIVTFILILLFIWRVFRYISSRLYVEKKLAVEQSGLIKEHCEPLDKVNFLEKECESLEPSLQDASHEESEEVRALKATNEQLWICKSKAEDEALFSEKQFVEKLKECNLLELEANILPKLQTLKDEKKSLKSRNPETETMITISQEIDEALKMELEKIFSANLQLLQCLKQRSETESWDEEFVKKVDQVQMTFENTKIQTEQLLKDTDHIKAKDLSSSLIVVEDITKNDDNAKLDMKKDTKNHVPLVDTTATSDGPQGHHDQEPTVATGCTAVDCGPGSAPHYLPETRFMEWSPEALAHWAMYQWAASMGIVGSLNTCAEAPFHWAEVVEVIDTSSSELREEGASLETGIVSAHLVRTQHSLQSSQLEQAVYYRAMLTCPVDITIGIPWTPGQDPCLHHERPNRWAHAIEAAEPCSPKADKEAKQEDASSKALPDEEVVVEEGEVSGDCSGIQHGTSQKTALSKSTVPFCDIFVKGPKWCPLPEANYQDIDPPCTWPRSFNRHQYLYSDTLVGSFVVRNRCPTFIGSATSYQLSKCSLHNTPSCGSLHPQSDSIEKLPTQTFDSRRWLISSTRILFKMLSIIYEGPQNNMWF